MDERSTSEKPLDAKAATPGPWTWETPPEQRADELDAKAADGRCGPLDVDDVMRWAREHHQAWRRTGSDGDLLEAKAMLVLALRLLTREAAR